MNIIFNVFVLHEAKGDILIVLVIIFLPLGRAKERNKTASFISFLPSEPPKLKPIS